MGTPHCRRRQARPAHCRWRDRRRTEHAGHTVQRSLEAARLAPGVRTRRDEATPQGDSVADGCSNAEDDLLDGSAMTANEDRLRQLLKAAPRSTDHLLTLLLDGLD